MKTFKLKDFARLIGENALVGVSSPSLSDDTFLPIRLLLSNPTIENLDFSNYIDTWLLIFKDDEAICAHDCGSLYVTYDLNHKAEMEVKLNFNYIEVMRKIEARLGNQLTLKIKADFYALVETQVEIELAIEGYYSYKSNLTIENCETNMLINKVIHEVVTLDKLMEMMNAEN